MTDPRTPYNSDGLLSHHNHDFMRDPAFLSAYARGVQAAEQDYGWYWRVHVGLWAASSAMRLAGDFVECGVNRGFLSSAIMHHLNWNAHERVFYLLDTFAGLDERYVSEQELAHGAMQKNQDALSSGFYTTNVDRVRANFSEWKNTRIVQGSIPETLTQITSAQVAFAHIDMNCAPPEVAALEYLWPRLVPGAMVLLDDYAYYGYEAQKAAMDEFSARHGVSIVSLPTGQGLLIRPPHEIRRLRCGVCGGSSFSSRPILWDRLIAEWQLNEDEARYINRQQGESCNQCGANLRSIALADALRAFLGTKDWLQQVTGSALGQQLSILEINEAGALTPVLKSFGRYVFGAYPQMDIHALPFDSGSFDVVIHSDTLEHVTNPVHALQECRRVLKPTGALCFTVPTIVERMSRSRAGLPKSYHGDPATATDDYVVQTEFGADVWTYLLKAGFTEVSIHCADYPAAIAYLARGHRP